MTNSLQLQVQLNGDSVQSLGGGCWRLWVLTVELPSFHSSPCRPSLPTCTQASSTLVFAEFVSLSPTSSVLSLLLDSGAGDVSDKTAEQTPFKNISVCHLLYFCMLHVCGFHRPEQGEVPWGWRYRW